MDCQFRIKEQKPLGRTIDFFGWPPPYQRIESPPIPKTWVWRAFCIAHRPAKTKFFYLAGSVQVFNSETRELLVRNYLNLYAIIKSSQISIMVIGGELIVQKEDEIFGAVLKSARQEAGFTVEALAERIGVTERYIYRLENNGKTPGYAVLCRLIRELAISPDLLFYPEKPTQDSEVDALIRKLATCDERAIMVSIALSA